MTSSIGNLKTCTFSDDPERPEVQPGTLHEGILVLTQEEKKLLRSKIISAFENCQNSNVKRNDRHFSTWILLLSLTTDDFIILFNFLLFIFCVIIVSVMFF